MTEARNPSPQKPTPDRLVNFLLEGEHPVELSQSSRESNLITDNFQSDYVSVTFTATRGGTAIGFRLDPSQSGVDEQRGRMHLEGVLILNDVPVRCIADIEMATLKGTGHLVLLQPDT